MREESLQGSFTAEVQPTPHKTNHLKLQVILWSSDKD